jgi:hypothetical protein
MFDTVDQGRPPSSRELGPLRDIRGLCDVGLVTRDQTTVPGGHEIGLDEIGTHLDGEPIGLERMFRSVPGGAAMGDDERCTLG